MQKNYLPIRLLCYFAGLFIMTMGIAISVKSDLGVSPVSSIPYTMTCVWGIEMGRATILFHAVLIAVQILLLRKSFQVPNLLQLPVGIVFGVFTTFCNSCAAGFPSPENLMLRIGMVLFSTVLVAIGIFFYMPADIMPLAGEGVMLAVSHVMGIAFPKVKMAFDITMVAISLAVCLLLIHRLGSVGIGTVIASVLVGNNLRIIEKHWGRHRDRLMGIETL